MKQLITLLILFLFGTFAYAAPGGGKPHKVTSYDYHDYVNNKIESKKFDRYEYDSYDGTNYKFYVEWKFERSQGQVRRREIKTGPEPTTTVVRHAMNVYFRTPDSNNWIQFNACDKTILDYCAVTRTQDYYPPLVELTDEMVPGVAWGSGGEVQSTNTGENYFTYKYELLAIEDVTVPAGTFTDCLKLHKIRQFSNSPYTRVQWHCPNLGVVKRIQGGNAIMEMTEVTYVD